MGIKHRVWDSINKKYSKKCENKIENFFSIEGAVLEQYTGLKDKNKKEIYESDIIKTKSGRLYVIDISLFYPISEMKNNFKKINRMFKPLEVIGNINENPELLELK